jgi:hypothetical protein
MEKEKEITPTSDYIKMDISLTTPEERVEKVKEIIANTPSEKLTPRYLEKLTDYIFWALDKKERLEHTISTDNRMKTVNKREFSFEGLVERLENGEDGIYNMIANDKNIIFSHKIEITEEDINTIPGLKDLVEEIKKVEELCKNARGNRAYLLKKQLIEMRKDQYEILFAYKKPIRMMNIKKTYSFLDLSEKIKEDENGNVVSTGYINLYNPAHISLLLCHYSKIKEECWDRFESDMRWMMEDLDNLIEKTFKDKYPLYYDLIIYKIDGKSNLEIQDLLARDHKVRHSVEYISALWRNKIPKMIAETASNDWLIWHYTEEERGKWKRCSKCGQIKLANNRFFSKNNTSKDGFYSICKECRNAKTKEKKILPKGV